MNYRPTEDIVYHVKHTEVTFFGNSDRGCRWLQVNTDNNPHTINKEHLEDFLSTLNEHRITHEATYRAPEI